MGTHSRRGPILAVTTPPHTDGASANIRSASIRAYQAESMNPSHSGPNRGA